MPAPAARPLPEVIVSDDGSSDKTRQIWQEFAKCQPNFILHLQDVNLGITANYNFLADKATGEYVAIFSGDDVMCEEKIDTQVKLLEANPSASFCHHGFLI